MIKKSINSMTLEEKIMLKTTNHKFSKKHQDKIDKILLNTNWEVPHDKLLEIQSVITEFEQSYLDPISLDINWLKAQWKKFTTMAHLTSNYQDKSTFLQIADIQYNELTRRTIEKSSKQSSKIACLAIWISILACVLWLLDYYWDKDRQADQIHTLEIIKDSIQENKFDRYIVELNESEIELLKKIIENTK